jgi:hypothetical protein
MDIGTYNCGPYPKWKYHAHEPPRFVATEYEDKSLGEEWLDEYQKQDWPQLRFNQETGEAKSVANPDEEGKLEGNWSATPPKRKPGEARLYSGDVTLEQVAESAKAKRRQALDYEQLNDELELKADNTAMKPVKPAAQPQPAYHEVNTPASDKKNKVNDPPESARHK